MNTQQKSKVLINGAFGKMGQTTVNAIEESSDFEIVALTGRQDPLDLAILETQPEIVIDFSNADAVLENAKIIIEEGVHPVIGTSGLTGSDVNYLKELCEEQKLGGIIAPNFSIGAILMMHFSEITARYLRYAEIIETHHEHKQDAPSGTAIKTAHLIAKSQEIAYVDTKKHIYENSRGANFNNVAIHSLRLPGKLAQQEVIFGSTGETLSIKHDTLDRACFMPGVLFACRQVTQLKTLVYGLENLLLKENSLEPTPEDRSPHFTSEEVFYEE